ncbi:D-2-hydroxyacid dehydrogenase [Microbacterium capsulatum]|uniref:D-2-hydroxyacid dehydrogenase n=1 Tax=Microbacterium capsulatum TaxID=3041921 RepID=A0ABU0XJZ0_9MICO|nr:D-2-hydroxyacid dehydrogenase [Microbacterium sp. ASV81]MDQ4215152.1 D-2-hydroxyacid dehydrogenase [Microbacterium sp. ASV81]
MTGRLRVAVAAPLAPELCELLTVLEPRIDLAVDQSLLPPMRHPADFSGDPSFRRTSEQQAAYEELLVTADVLYGIPDVDPGALARVVRANPRLRWVHTMAAGGGGQVRGAQLTAAELERVVFTTSAGVHGDALAEFAVFGVFAGAKHLPRLLEQQRERVWSGRWMMGQVSDQTVLVLGLGGIGAMVAAKLSALGVTVIGTSRRGAAVPGVARTIHPDAATEVLPHVDAVVTTLPGTDATYHLIGREFLSVLKQGATVVNVGRGTVIDESALLDALNRDVVGFAALDVFEVEPLPEDSPLWAHPRVLVSPHTAALDAREDRRIAELFAENATRFLDGRPLRNVVDTVEFY